MTARPVDQTQIVEQSSVADWPDRLLRCFLGLLKLSLERLNSYFVANAQLDARSVRANGLEVTPQRESPRDSIVLSAQFSSI